MAFWETLGTWTWGCRFSESGDLEIRASMYEPFQPGSYPGGSVSIGPITTEWQERGLWNELKRGWRMGAAELRREQPGADAGVTLGLMHHGVDFRRPGIEGVQLEYFLAGRPDYLTPLPGAAWDREGRLLMATRDGTLEIFRCEGAALERVWTHDLRGLTPDPQAAPHG